MTRPDSVRWPTVRTCDTADAAVDHGARELLAQRPEGGTSCESSTDSGLRRAVWRRLRREPDLRTAPSAVCRERPAAPGPRGLVAAWAAASPDRDDPRLGDVDRTWPARRRSPRRPGSCRLRWLV